MVPLHSSVMIEHVPLYLDGSLSYISSRNFRLSPPTLEPSDPILNTASILLSLHSLSPPRASTLPLATIPSSVKTLEDYYLLAALHISTTTL